MRILFLNHNVVRHGGTFFRAYEVAKGLAARGHEVTLVTISEKERFHFGVEHSDGIKLVTTPDLMSGRLRTGWDPWDTLCRGRYVFDKCWDVIHGWDCRPAVILPALVARNRSSNCRLVLDWCDWFGRNGTQAERPGGFEKRLYQPIETFFEEKFRRFADASTVISKRLFDRAVGLGIAADTIHYLPQGCRTVYPPADSNGLQRARVALGVPLNKSVLLTIGKVLQSDAGVFYPALRTVFAADQRSIVIMVGNHQSVVPPDLRATGRIIETGHLKTAECVDEYMLAADALLVPMANTLANLARWPSKVNPFLAVGKPVIITRVGDLPALLESRSAAFVCDPDAGSFASSILSFLGSPTAHLERNHQARNLALNELSWARIVEKLERVYMNEAHISSQQNPGTKISPSAEKDGDPQPMTEARCLDAKVGTAEAIPF